MNEPLPEARQAAEHINQIRINYGYGTILSVDEMTEILKPYFDAATAKLREQLDKLKEAVNLYGNTGSRIAWQKVEDLLTHHDRR